MISANKGLDPEVASSDLLRQGIEILQDPETTFRFDGSDLMPGAVGADSFWKGIVSWVSGETLGARHHRGEPGPRADPHVPPAVRIRGMIEWGRDPAPRQTQLQRRTREAR